MVLTEANFASKTGVLSMSVTALTFQGLRFNHLTACLMFKLIIFAEKLKTEAASEASATVVPHPSLTLDTFCVSEDTATGVTLQTLLAVTHPGLAEVTNGTNHLCKILNRR